MSFSVILVFLVFSTHLNAEKLSKLVFGENKWVSISESDRVLMVLLCFWHRHLQHAFYGVEHDFTGSKAAKAWQGMGSNEKLITIKDQTLIFECWF